MSVVNGSLAEHGTIWQEYDDGSEAQLWTIQLLDSANQTYKFINSYSRMAFASTSGFGNSYQTAISSTNTDQIFQISLATNECWVKPYPFVSYYLIVGSCMLTPVQVGSAIYLENTNSWDYCQQYIFQEASKLAQYIILS